MPSDLGFHFQNYIFSNILGSTYWLQSIWKNNTKNFFLFVYLLLFVYFFINSALKPQHLLFVYKQRTQASTPLIANEPFLHKMLVLFFSSNILLFNEKNPVEKLCKQGYY